MLFAPQSGTDPTAQPDPSGDTSQPNGEQGYTFVAGGHDEFSLGEQGYTFAAGGHDEFSLYLPD